MAMILLSASALLGLCLGSFMHVAIYRFAPDKTGSHYLYDIIFSRSTCPCCHHRLAYLTLIPVIAWLIQAGRCRYCRQPIALHYLLTEVIVAVGCTLMISVYGVTLWTIILIVVGLYFTVLAIIDIRFLLLPNYFIYPILLSGVLLAILKVSDLSLSDAVLGIPAGYLLLWLPATGYHWLKGQTGLGYGDIKLLSALGAWVHYSQLPWLIISAALLGIIYGLMLCWWHKTRLKTVLIPFGPCLLLAAYAILLCATLKQPS